MARLYGVLKDCIFFKTTYHAISKKNVFLRTLFEEGKLAERLKAAVSKTARV